MNASIGKYLKAYNLVQLAGWLIALVSLSLNPLVAIITVVIFQTLSLLEIFHAYEKWTFSSPFFCFVQIGARLFILFFTCLMLFATIFKPIPYFEYIVYLMLATWSVAEIIRYYYYVIQLFKKENKTATWLRYSAFIICYPIGLLCEFYIMFTVFKYNNILAIKILMVIVAIIYIFLFPKLYKHLLKQRKQKLPTVY